MDPEMEQSETMAWTCPSAGKPMQYLPYIMPPLRSTDVQIQVTHNGLSQTDVVMRDNGWGVTKFPFVPGHEFVGIVTHVGSHCRKLRIGDRVGVGWIRDSCGECEACMAGQQNLCYNNYSGTVIGLGQWKSEYPCGGYARQVRINENFAYKIPYSIKSEEAAPLMCAGATVFAPLRKYVKPGMRVGIAGIGGLGHLAIAFTKAMGAMEIVAISSSDEKRQLATRYGATKYIDMSNEEEQEEAKYSLDFILNTIPVPHSYNEHIVMLRNGGTYCLVGIPVANVSLFVPQVVFHQYSIVGSIVAGESDITEMFKFCVKHNVRPEVKEDSMMNIDACLRSLKEEKVPHRYVLKFTEDTEEEEEVPTVGGEEADDPQEGVVISEEVLTDETDDHMDVTEDGIDIMKLDEPPALKPNATDMEHAYMQPKGISSNPSETPESEFMQETMEPQVKAGPGSQ